MKILAATDFSTRSNRALRQAGLLAQVSGASLAVVHVVDDDQPQALLEMERREANEILREQMIVMPELQSTRCDPLVVTGSAFSGILDAAKAMGADLIVMGAHRRQLLRDIFVGTTVERVIRTGPFPVLMVRSVPFTTIATMLAAPWARGIWREIISSARGISGSSIA